MFIGLNPSTADHTEDDPTIRRCVTFARDWGFDALCMANLFAWRATDPMEMRSAGQAAVGSDNDSHLKRLSTEAGLTVAAWGAMGTFLGRDLEVRRLLSTQMHALRLTKDGHPGHPLYLPKNLTPFVWHDDSW